MLTDGCTSRWYIAASHIQYTVTACSVDRRAVNPFETLANCMDFCTVIVVCGPGRAMDQLCVWLYLH